MPLYPHAQQQIINRLLWSGILAIGILCLLATWNFNDDAEYAGSDAERSEFTVAVDLPLHANSEHSFAPKRFFNRYKDQPKPAESIEPIWALTDGEVTDSLLLVVASQQHPVTHSPHVYQYQLQTLNSPRAPPLV